MYLQSKFHIQWFDYWVQYVAGRSGRTIIQQRSKSESII